ncbi:glycosyltransferase-like protein gnt13 [Solenopsis invicta]|uniref:glycosyltransferase-like protein gnt13 n=1 Tax=Solenopsis invicta TaxID=13686 RepID=UPI00193DCC90|nr:glycosyltransferase-like protein gnt13 [Solenopsis invicta]
MKRGPYKKYLKINNIPIPGRTVHRHLIENVDGNREGRQIHNVRAENDSNSDNSAIIERQKSYKQYLRANNIAIPKRTEHRRHLRENIEANEENRNNRIRNVQVEGMNDVDNDRPILVDNNDDVIRFNINQQNIEQNTINNTDDNGTTDSDWSNIHHNKSDLIDDDESEIFHDAIEKNLEQVFIPQVFMEIYGKYCGTGILWKYL